MVRQHAPDPPPPPPVLALAKRSNSELIFDCARLGYIYGHVLDPTWGLGRFWRRYDPEKLTRHDKFTFDGVDFRELPEPDCTFDTVVFDPPYKLNGTPRLGDFDAAYGIDKKMSWREKMDMIRDGITECHRVLKPFYRESMSSGQKVGGFLLVKCMDQVCSGEIRWQTDEFSAHAISLGMKKVDSLEVISHRPQPGHRLQVHAQRCTSTMLVFRRLVV